MYCGDETGAFIGDIGSNSSRFGYGGEDNPKYVIPSAVGDHKSILTSAYHDRFDSVQPVYRTGGSGDNEFPQVDPNAFLQQGDFIEDYDAYEQLWSSSFDVLRVRDKLKHTKGEGSVDRSTSNLAGDVSSETVRSSEQVDTKIPHPLLAVTHGNTCIVGEESDDAATQSTQYQASLRRKETKQITEILLEKLGAPAIFIAPTPMLASFSHGRQTALVVDMGAGGCRITPVVDGFVLKHAQRRNGRGTDWLGHVCAKAIPQNIVPRYQVNGQEKSKSAWFHTWAMLDVMYEFRTSQHVSLAQWRYDSSVPFMNVRKDEKDQQASAQGTNSYELPDGTYINLDTSLGKDLCRIPELLFTDQLPFVGEMDKSVLSQSDTLSDLPLSKLIHASLTAIDADLRKELCGNILLCGGGSLVTNLEQRLSYEMMTTIPATHKCRVIASRNSSERTNAAWIGGSILTSLGSFQQLWLSQQEYQEYGTTLAVQRFP